MVLHNGSHPWQHGVVEVSNICCGMIDRWQVKFQSNKLLERVEIEWTLVDWVETVTWYLRNLDSKSELRLRPDEEQSSNLGLKWIHTHTHTYFIGSNESQMKDRFFPPSTEQNPTVLFWPMYVILSCHQDQAITFLNPTFSAGAVEDFDCTSAKG